jgi:hypothetical protein
MDICIFYSWQSKYHDNCDKIIGKALDKAVKELNSEQHDYHYVIKRGGGDAVGEEDITDNIDKIIQNEADIAIVDFTHTGNIPHKNPDTGEWIKEKCLPNACATNEHGKLVTALDKRQVFKVYNTAYGEIDVNLEPPFDLRQKHYPVSFFCDDTKTNEDRVNIKDTLSKGIKDRIRECTAVFIDNQKVRYAPLVPIRNEYTKKLYSTPFKKTEAFTKVLKMVEDGQSFRLLGLPGLGKTRMIGESFRGRDNDVYYCDCREQLNKDVNEAVERLMNHRGNRKQTVVLDNCNQLLCGQINDTINEYGYNCQLITVHYDPSERTDSGVESIPLKVEDFGGVVENMVEQVKDMPKEVKEAITSLAGGFPLMAAIMIDNFCKGISIANVSKGDVFNRMLGLDANKATDSDKLKVLTAFSIFKFIGLYGSQEKQGRFVANNKIITNIRGTEDENMQLFKEVHGQYQKVEILERQGNLVLMRLIPLAIYLCKSWFDKQTTDSISDLINQIRSCPDEGTRNMLIESLSRRITLLAEVPLAKELNDGLTDPDKSPFLTEEVVLSSLGSRLFLAFSEVNPEACAFALHRMIANKNDEEIKALEPARRNLAWALDHLAFDKRSFRWAMLTLARFSLVETESQYANNTTGLFIDRFPILLPGTEVDLMTRIDVLKELSKDRQYRELVKKSLHRALGTSHFQRTGGAEKQGTKKLKDYIPTFQEVSIYYNASLDMLLELAETQQDIDDIAKTLANNAHGYYTQGESDFLFRGLEILAPKKNYVWEEMKSSLSYLIDYNARKGSKYRLDEIEDWKNKLTKEDYVYKLLHMGNDIMRHHNSSYHDNINVVREEYDRMAKELINQQLYKDSSIISGILQGECFYYNTYGYTLSSYSKEVGVQKELLDILLNHVLFQEVSRNGESLLLYFMVNVKDKELLKHIYEVVLNSEKKRLLPAMYAIKNVGEDKLAQLFEMLDNDEISINDFSGYFNYHTLDNYDVKYVAGRLLDYGAEGAGLVLSHCHNLLFGDKDIDAEYQAIARKCLMLVDLQGIQMNDFLYLQSMNNYLVKHRDEEMALHIHDLQKMSFDKNLCSSGDYYLGQLYRKVFKRYPELLKPKLFELLDDEKGRHSWIDLLSTGYPQEQGEEEPMYMLIPIDEWFLWLDKATANDRAYALAMMFSYASGSEASSEMLRLLDGYWCDEVRDAISCRFHSYSWTGTGIPLYKNRIAICKDFVSRLTNLEAKEWFKKDIPHWENEIEKELLHNAHEKAIYD